MGKGWFNLQEANMETYEFSKLKKFLTLTRFVMEDTLRFLVEESLQKYVAFINTCCSAKVRQSAGAGVCLGLTHGVWCKSELAGDRVAWTTVWG